MSIVSFCSGSLNNLKQPHPILEQVWQNALVDIDSSTLTQYPNPKGNAALCQKLLELFAPQGAFNILITPSATSALYLIFLEMAAQKKQIAVQTPSYFGVSRQIKALGLSFQTWESIQEFKNIAPKTSFVYLNSNFHSVHGQSLSLEQKQEIKNICKTTQTVIVEDNACDLLYFNKNRPKKLLDMVSENIYYVSSGAKILGPRMPGFIISTSQNIQKVKSHHITVNLGTSTLDQLVMLKALNQNYLSLLRSYNQNKWDIFEKQLLKYNLHHFEKISGGIFVKLNISQDKDVSKFVFEAKQKGVLIEENKFYYPDRKNRPYIRLNFIRNNKEENDRGLKTLSQILEKSNETT